MADSPSVITPIAPEPAPEPELIRFNTPPPAPIAAPAVPSSASETRFLTVDIAELAGGWPGLIQQEISSHHLMTSSLALPMGLIENALKQGKIVVPWKVLRSWIKPPVLVASSPNDAIMLELPLKIITPLFLAEMKASKPQKKLTVDPGIPNLFSNRTQNAPPMPVVPATVGSSAQESTVVPLNPISAGPVLAAAASAPIKQTDTNYFAKANGDMAEEAAPPIKPGPSPGTAFLQRYATPNEIVSKAAALDGVDGTLIALPDGLLVASRIPQGMNADTVAGFLPQIFNRVSQCTKELRLGELNNLNFTVGNVPWKIFKVGAIFFAAFGRPGEPLPSGQLAGIAAELDRKAK